MDTFINIYKAIKINNILTIDNSNDIIYNTIHTHFTIYFYMNDYIHDIIQSYNKNSNKIISQFNNDYDRTNIMLNKVKYKSANDFITELGKITNNYALIILLCCQSSLAFPVEILHKLFLSNENNNITIIHNTYIKSSINITINENNILINIDVSFSKIIIEPYKILAQIIITLSINLSNTDSENINNNICIMDIFVKK